jgi:16S rRNA (uracil1498-N3)-methyltransferase
MITVLVAPERLVERQVRVEGTTYRHLVRARRATGRDRLRVVDGRGTARWGTLVAVDKKGALLELGGEAPQNEASCRLELFVVPPKPQRLTWLVEKATEAGVAAIHMLYSQRGPRTYGASMLARLRRVAAAAVEQSHRSRVPEISGMLDPDEAATLVAGCEQSWLLDPNDERSLPDANQLKTGSLALLVGPEGGWTASEVGQWTAKGARRLGLGPRTLRIETAAVVGAAVLLLLHSQNV